MSKGSGRRPKQISDAEETKRWNDAFGTRKPLRDCGVCSGTGRVNVLGLERCPFTDRKCDACDGSGVVRA